MSDMPRRFLAIPDIDGVNIELPARDGLPASRHCNEARSLHAINAALASGRPLLVRGEPGTGKTQLARAAAELLGRAYVCQVVDSQTQIADLFYCFDAVERLARAQVAGALRHDTTDGSIEELLDERNFVRPGPLWWAFDASGAREQWLRHARSGHEAGAAVTKPADADRGHVVLIDEIDKADPSIPNGLLARISHQVKGIPAVRARLEPV